MSSKKKILIQIDTDTQPSVFDRIVAIDAGADEVIAHGGVTPQGVRDLVHGAMFTRGPKDLHRTAIFIGGSDVGLGEEILTRVSETFFANLRVSVLLDSSGANTTAAAAVTEIGRVHELSTATALVLGGTGPVGRRVARLLARRGAGVRLASRDLERARSTCEELACDGVEPVATGEPAELARALEGVRVVVSAGGAGVRLLPAAARADAKDLAVVADLNAVPPYGVDGVEPTDCGAERDDVLFFGALGVGGTKMKIHRAAVAALFERNDRIFDAEAVLEIGDELFAK